MPVSPDALSYALEPFFSRGAALLALALLVAYLVRLSLRPKRFYVVRHGQTIANAERIKQGEAGGLTEGGKEEAARVGEALRGLGITEILSSPYLRTKETALIMSGILHVPVRYTPLLAERRNPSEVVGKSADDPKIAHIVDEIDLAYHDDEYRYSDEENFSDLKKRAKKCLAFLARRGARATCVVTHHAFLKILLAYLLYRDALTAADYVKLFYFNVSDNGGITTLEYDPWRRWNKTRGWEIVSFNETAQAE